jgi:seryl-tRNA synthetase
MLVECQKLLDDKKKEIKQKMTEIRVLKDSV